MNRQQPTQPRFVQQENKLRPFSVLSPFEDASRRNFRIDVCECAFSSSTNRRPLSIPQALTQQAFGPVGGDDRRRPGKMMTLFFFLYGREKGRKNVHRCSNARFRVTAMVLDAKQFGRSTSGFWTLITLTEAHSMRTTRWRTTFNREHTDFPRLDEIRITELATRWNR